MANSGRDEMNIEAGKFYKTRDGKRVGPVVATGNSSWPFRLGKSIWYKDDGHSCRGSANDMRASDDLIAEWIDTPQVGDTGTLEQLGVQAGDVVEYCGDEYVALEEPKPRGAIGLWAGTVAGGWVSDESICRLISRDTPQPKTFDEMTDAEQGALLVAKHRGEVIQVSLFGTEPWTRQDEPQFNGQHAYREKPKPVVDEVIRHVNMGEGRGVTHKLKAVSKDGEIDCDSAVLVKL